jgi:hypothetical protein
VIDVRALLFVAERKERVYERVYERDAQKRKTRMRATTNGYSSSFSLRREY